MTPLVFLSVSRKEIPIGDFFKKCFVFVSVVMVIEFSGKRKEINYKKIKVKKKK